ncbi:MAG: DUF4270 family protein [Bacteroidales bacterium]|nr:DUF4270 family protein [Bacteroidales bacterium]
MIKLSEKQGSAAAIIQSLKKHIHSLPALLLVLTFILLSCEEDPSHVGIDILPRTDFDSIVAIDTMGIEMYTLFTDSATSMQPPISYLGNILDPYFGLTGSDFVTQLWLAAAWPGEGFTVDSVKMQMEISDVIGEMMGAGSLKLYEIDEMLSTDSTYLVSRDIGVREMLASVEIPQLPEGTDTTLTLDLPVSFGEYMLRDTSMLFLRSDTLDFRSFFHGLYFEYPQAGSFHMLEINVTGPLTLFTIYYTNAQQQSRTYNLTINNNCIIYNRFIHDFEQAETEKRIKYINEPVLDTLAYVQSMEGVYARLSIPSLEYLRTIPYDIAVNKARIYLPVYRNETDYTDEKIPSNILVRYDSAGVRRVLTDYLIDAAFLDGSYNSETGQYKINISNFVQDYFEGNVLDPVIEIYLPELSTRNLIIKANRDSGDAVRFELTYTVLKD